MAQIKDAKKANFELKKFKVKNGKVVTDYIYRHDENPDAEFREYKGVVIPLQPHPDLLMLFSQLREYLLRDYYIEPSAENLMQVEISSVGLSGSDETYGCIINGVLDGLNGGRLALNSSRIVFSKDESGIEQEVEVIIDSIIDESFKYLFKGKRADPTLFESLDADSDVEDKEVLDAEVMSVPKPRKAGLNVA